MVRYLGSDLSISLLTLLDDNLPRQTVLCPLESNSFNNEVSRSCLTLCTSVSLSLSHMSGHGNPFDV